jgi:hypothetical protein
VALGQLLGRQLSAHQPAANPRNLKM